MKEVDAVCDCATPTGGGGGVVVGVVVGGGGLFKG